MKRQVWFDEEELELLRCTIYFALERFDHDTKLSNMTQAFAVRQTRRALETILAKLRTVVSP